MIKVLALLRRSRNFSQIATESNFFARFLVVYQRCFNVVVKTLHQRYRMDVVSTWNQGLFFDVNWQPKFNVVSTLFLGRRINVVELTLFQRGIRVDFSSTSLNDVVTTSCNRRQNDLHFQHFYNVVSTDV